jgi:KDO2-lipid IV(A) lauroyltransferase
MTVASAPSDAGDRPEDESRLLQLVYHGYVAGSAAARALPEPLVYGTAHTLGTLAARRSKRRPLVERNLARVTGNDLGSPELASLVDDAFRAYARYWLETFRLVREQKDFFLDRVKVTNPQNLEAGKERGLGTVAVVSHLGNYDAAGAWAASSGLDVVTIAEVLRPRRMFDFFVAHRSKLGMRIHPSRSGATDVLAREAREGAVVAIVGDRDLRQSGPMVDFFGEPAHLPAGPAIVAAKSGAPLVVAGVYSRESESGKHGWHVDVGEPFEVATGSEGVEVTIQEIARRLEGYIGRRPQEWQALFQRFWIADRGER